MFPGIFRFVDFELDRNVYELRRKGNPLKLERIPLDLLFLLVDQRNRLVTREEILERLWGKGVFFDVDNAINSAVRKLRRALGDKPEAPRFVLTVPSKGYRFIADVCEESLAAANPPSSTQPAAVAPRKSDESQIRQADTSAPEHLEGERKTVTVLLVDFKGSKRFVESLDPEEARAIVDPALKLMIDAVHQYGGYVTRSTDDGIFAMFGAPIAHEDHPQRALSAALRMQAELKRYAEKLRAEKGVTMQVRAGAHTGEVVVREIRTGEKHTEYGPIGPSTSVAAHLQTMAAPGSVAITESMRKLVDGYFTLKSRGPARINGVSEPLEIYEVTGPGPLRTRFQRAAARGYTKFVGRQREIDTLKHAAESAQAGRGQIVAAMAEPGVGKSRLFYEFKAAIPRECKVLEAYSVSHGKASAWLPVLELLRGYFGIRETDAAARRREKIRIALNALDPALADTLPYLFGLLGIVEGLDPHTEMEARIKRQRTLEAIKRIITRDSLRQPLVVIFEDLHWIDEHTQALLDLLADSVASMRILMLVNYRPEYRHGWGNKTYYTQLRLDPLGRESAAEILSALLGDAVELNALKRLISEGTQGNPFFIEEIVQGLFDEGALIRNGTVKIARSLSQLRLPSTVQALLASRIDRLPLAHKELLQTLAVIGRESSLELIRKIASPAYGELDEMLAVLQAGEFVYEQPSAVGVEYVFKHALTQEVAYNSLLIERRKKLHERVGAATETLFANQLDDHVASLAHHYSHSDNIGKAIEYLAQAGQQAMRRSAHLEAISHLKSGLQFLMKLPETPERDRQELALQAALGPSLIGTQGDSTPEVEAVYGRIAELGERTGQTRYVFEAQGGLFLSYMVRGQLKTAHGFAEQLLSRAQASNDPDQLLIAHGFMGTILLWKGDLTIAHTHFKQAAAHFDLPRQRHIAALYGMDTATGGSGYAAFPLWMLGYPEQALERTRRALSLARERNHLSSSAMALNQATTCYLLRLEPQIAQELAEAGLALANEHGFGLWAALNNISLGCALAQSGQESKGIAHMEEGFKAAFQKRISLGRTALGVGALALAYAHTGRAAEGLRLIVEALAAVDANGYGQHSFEPELHRIKGELLLLDPSRLEAAEHCFRTAIEKARRDAAKSWQLRATTSLARLLRDTNRRDEARSMLADVYNWFTEGFDTVDLKDAKALLDELARGS